MLSIEVFLSTLSLRRATYTAKMIVSQVRISIHALLAESDIAQLASLKLFGYFYPRSPCGERPFIDCNSNFTQKFLSTLSLRRATAVTTVVVGPSSDFYPRSPCGERQEFLRVVKPSYNFYPRSPCGERRY